MTTMSSTNGTTDSADKSEFLKLFWTLAESDVATRTSAATQLLAYLRDHNDDVNYTLKRLVRGLASSRDAARQGFSAALAALLAEFPRDITLTETLELLIDAMQVTASMKAMEQREHMFGKLFGLLALHRSGRLLETENEPFAVQVVQQLIEMSAWKKWLREACVEAILSILSDAPKQLFLRELATPLGAMLEGDVSGFNADQVALAVGLHRYIHHHKLGSDSSLPATYPARDFVRRKHMHALAEPLKHSTICFPRVHGAWCGLFGHLLHGGHALDRELFQEAWTVLVENLLLAAGTTTHERKGLALKLFELVVPTLPGAVLRAILTPNLVKCLYNNSVSKKTYLHDAAKHTLKAFATHAPEEFFHFMEREFTKPMPALVDVADDTDDADKEELKNAVKSGGFDAIIAIEEERERQAARLRRFAAVRLWALELLATELAERLQRSEDDKTLRDRVLGFLASHAFFAPTSFTSSKISTKKSKKSESDGHEGVEVPEPALSADVRRAVAKKLFSCMSIALSSDAQAPLVTVFGFVDTRMGAWALRQPLDDEQQALWATAQQHAATLRAKKDKEATDEALALLLMSCALQLVDDDAARGDAQTTVADLVQCVDALQASTKTKATGKHTKAAKSKAEEEKEKQDEAVVVLTDLLLSLLSQDSSAMREVVTHVFKGLAPRMTATSLQTLVAAVAPEKEADGEAEAANASKEGPDDDEEDMEEDMEEEEVVLSSAADIADALRDDAQLAELHREDQTLSAIVGQVKDKARAKKDAKRHRLQVLHFKLRVVELLALYAASAFKSNDASLVSLLVLPLFESLTAIASSDVEQRVLKERLQAVLLHKLLKGLSGVTPSPTGEAPAALERAVTLLSTKALDKELVNKVGAAVFVQLVRDTAAAPSNEDALAKCVRTAVVDVFTRKHAKFPRAALEELATKHASLALRLLMAPLVEVATATASDKDEKEALAAVDDFSTAEVFRLLSLLLKPKHVGADEKAVFTGQRLALLKALVALLQRKKAAEDKSEMKAKRLKVVLSCALQLVRTWRAVDGDSKTTKTQKDLAPLVAALEALETSSPVVKNMVKQVVQAVSGETDDHKKEHKSEPPSPVKSAKSEKKSKKTPTKRKRSNSMAAEDDDE